MLGPKRMEAAFLGFMSRRFVQLHSPMLLATVDLNLQLDDRLEQVRRRPLPTRPSYERGRNCYHCQHEAPVQHGHGR